MQNETEAAQPPLKTVATSISDWAQRQKLERRPCETERLFKKTKMNKMLISQVEVMKRGVFYVYLETKQ